MTRQIIVSDIALLRANGQPIAAERRGYFLKKEGGVFKTVICRHDADGLTDEFYAVVDNGGKVLNVIVEHPLYGQISAELNIASRFDADEFAKKEQGTESGFSVRSDGRRSYTYAFRVRRGVLRKDSRGA